MNEINELGVLEGILFVVGDEGITLQNLCEIMKIDEVYYSLKDGHVKQLISVALEHAEEQ